MTDEETAKKSGSKNLIIVVIVTLLIAGGGGFFAGMKYQQSKLPNFAGRFDRAGAPNRVFGQNGNGAANGFNYVRGKIISISDNSVTVEEADSSSKIVILNDTTAINKSEEGSKSDLTDGTEVVVFGQTNSDGSVTAQNIQIGTGLLRNQPPQQ